MTKSIQEILSPLLIISYVCGLRLKFPVGDQRQWYNLLYLLLLWALYFLIAIYSISYKTYYFMEYYVCIGIHCFTTLISIIVGIYYDKTFRNCIKKLVIVDDTLKKLGKTTNYYKFKIKIVCFTLGWSVIIILATYLESYAIKGNINILSTSIIISSVRNYCIYILCIGDLIIVIILGYIGLKFDQINEDLKKLSEDNKCRIKLAWEHSKHMLRSCKAKFSNISKKKYITKCNKIWIIMHLHSELRKISREIDCIFGIQMTLEMGCYFACIAVIFRQIFCFTYKKHYINNEILHFVILITWLSIYIFRLLLINYICERISTKANATGNFINRVSYLTYDSEIHENILQFLLQVQSPLRFYGLGLFQFGFKFLYGFFASVSTVLVIYTQAFTSNKYLKNNYKCTNDI